MDKEQAIEIIETHSENILSDSLVGRALNMAIDALKAQLSCEGATSALIDRQAAIDAINSWRGRFSEEYNEAIDDCENSIKALPTIQPEATDTNFGDIISRQQALDIFDDYNVSVEYGELEAYSRDRKRLCELQSVQPERKKGKWIYNSPVTMKCDQCGLVIKDWDWHRFKFCPNCDCDMRGEQE